MNQAKQQLFYLASFPARIPPPSIASLSLSLSIPLGFHVSFFSNATHGFQFQVIITHLHEDEKLQITGERPSF